MSLVRWVWIEALGHRFKAFFSGLGISIKIRFSERDREGEALITIRE